MGGTKHHPKSAALLVIAAFAGGCVNATYIPTGAAYAPRPHDCPIEVFSSHLPEREYHEIGILEGEGSFWKADLEDVLPRFQEEACLAGGDALILHSANRYATGEDGDENIYAFATVVRWVGGGE